MDRREAGSVREDGVRLLARGPGFCFGAWQNVYVLEWRDVVTFESLDAAVRCKAAVAGANPAGIVVLNLLRAESPLPNATVRRHAEKRQNDDLEGVLAHATVIEGDGFRASAMRSMLAGFLLVARSKFPRRAFDRVDEAIRWQASVLSATEAWVAGCARAVAGLRDAP